MPRRRAVRALAPVFLAALCLAPLFVSLGDHAILGDSEARYGTIARGMALEGAPLLIPHLFGEPHITKPPLAYWAMAASIRVLGDSLWALRLPSACFGALTLWMLYRFGRTTYGSRRAWCVVMLATVCPLFIVVSRMATTDALLGMACTISLLAGVRAVETGRGRWALLSWVGVGVGLLAKGPAALLPALALVGWLVWRRDWVGLRRLRWKAGLPLAVTPLLLWAFYTWSQVGGAGEVWRYETLSRAAGTGDHLEPWWFFAPVLLAGFAPAWVFAFWSRRPLANPPTSSDRFNSPWLTVIGLYVVAFSVIAGKLMSYLLPLIGPICLWAVMQRFPPPKHVPARDGTGPDPAPRPALLVAWGVMWCVLMGGLWVEDRVAESRDPAPLVAQARAVTGLDRPTIYTVGFTDRRLIWYTNRPTRRIDPRVLDPVWATMPKREMVVLAEPAAWDGFAADPHWDLGRRFEQVGHTAPAGGHQTLRVYRTLPEHWEPREEASGR